MDEKPFRALIAAAAVAAVIVVALATRYDLVPGQGPSAPTVFLLDRWTGDLEIAFGVTRRPVSHVDEP